MRGCRLRAPLLWVCPVPSSLSFFGGAKEKAYPLRSVVLLWGELKHLIAPYCYLSTYAACSTILASSDEAAMNTSRISQSKRTAVIDSNLLVFLQTQEQRRVSRPGLLPET